MILVRSILFLLSSIMRGSAATDTPTRAPLINSGRMSRRLRSLSTYPKHRTQRIWHIDPYEPDVPYSVRMASPTAVTVLANGSREVFRKRVKRDLPGRFVVEGRTLIYETFPRAEERHRRAVSKSQAKLADRAARETRARANPSYKAFVRRLTAELGRPRQAGACDRRQLAFRAPSDERCAELIQEARRSGASATLYLARWGRELRVVAGRVGQLAALFDWEMYGMGTFEPALDALDRDAGVTIDYVGWFGIICSFTLDHRPPRRNKYLGPLSELFNMRLDVLARCFQARSLVIGDRSEADAVTRLIEDPGTVPEE
jgi:hypothetical protein